MLPRAPKAAFPYAQPEYTYRLGEDVAVKWLEIQSIFNRRRIGTAGAKVDKDPGDSIKRMLHATYKPSDKKRQFVRGMCRLAGAVVPMPPGLWWT